MDSAKTTAYFKKIEQVLKLLSILNLTGYEWPKQTCVQDGANYDFIVVGGGTAGCLIASRLVEEGNAKVLLIEAGGLPPLESDMAGLFPLLAKSKYDWNFTSTHDGSSTKHHKNNVVHMSQGKMLGGSGSLTIGCYMHGYPHDFNEWAAITNDSSWSWKSVLPLLKKNERLIDPVLLKTNHSYGTSGKIDIRKQYYKRNNDFFKALKEIGYDYHLDINENYPIGFTNMMFSDGAHLRQSTATKFLSPLKKNKNLHLMLNTLATEIIFDDKKTAIGVKVITDENRKLTIKAKKEVIVTCGTIKSPHLLMLSGIGPKCHLQSKGIKVVVDLPVGKNFQDHVNSAMVYKMTKASHATKVENPNKYPYAVFDGYVALNKCQCYPDYQTIGAHFGDTVTFLAICSFYFNFDDEFCNTIGKGVDNKEILLMFITYVNPESRGEILLKSNNPTDYPLIYPGYYTNKIDIKRHASYLADFNRVLNSTYFRSVDAEFVDPKSKECKGMKLFSEEYWRCYTVAASDTSHYFVGTCSMGAVVDSQLRVYGVKRLRVADASIMPSNTRGFIQSSVMMVARKASDMIIQDWGLI